MKKTLLAVGAIGLAAMGSAGTYDLLVPRPVKAEASGGMSRAEDLTFTVRTGRVAGAPACVAAEAYMLEIGAREAIATANGAQGARYARVTFDQLRALGGGAVPRGRIVDWPRLRWRGYMNDCGRNFLDLDAIKTVLDVMARYKLNLFHWHLTDYHGWRLESKRYPALQKRDAFRRQIGRYYTQAEFREIVAYAAARGITVMPELDVPGHTLALRRGLGVPNMAAPGVGEKVTELFRELCTLAPPEAMPFIHLGTDEARTLEEKCDDAWIATWAKAVNACGRTAVVWAPGKQAPAGCDIVSMAWDETYVTNSTLPFFYADSLRLYQASWTPFDVLSHIVYADVGHWKSAAARQLGAIGCTWHDDNIGEDTRQLFRECAILPALVGFGESFWAAHGADRPEFIARLPHPSDPQFAEAVAFERRVAAQRDTVLADLTAPFPFVKQTDMRWRLTDAATGRVIATDIAQGTVWVRNRRRAANSFLAEGTNTVALETWIHAPKPQTIGAWIDCAGYFGGYTRLHGRTMAQGEWNPVGARVLLNGADIPPPVWKQPAMVSTTTAEREQDIPYSTDLLEKPLVDELPTLREPTRLTLRAGWNHVRIILPFYRHWGATFCPVSGTSAHPREVQDLTYSATPR